MCIITHCIHVELVYLIGVLISLICLLMRYAMNDTDIVENNISPCQYGLASVIDVNDMELGNGTPAKCSFR